MNPNPRTPEPQIPEQTDHKHRTPEEEDDESLDKTIADSFPASDPPSSIPDPDGEENAA